MNDDIGGKLLGLAIENGNELVKVREAVESTNRSVQRLTESNEKEHGEIRTDIEPIVAQWKRRKVLKSYGKWAAVGIVGLAGGITTMLIGIQAIMVMF